MERGDAMSPEGVLWRVVFADKRVSRAQIRAFSLRAALAVTHIENMELRRAGMLLLALAKMVSRKMRLLLEDSTGAFQVICRERYAVVRSLKTPSSRPITLGVGNENLYISDDMLDLGDEMILPRDETSLLESAMSHFDAEFADFSNIEQVRESTLVGSSSIVPNNESSFVMKRRRVIEDSVVEYDLDVLRTGARSAADAANRRRREEIQSGLCSTLHIDPKILAMLKIADGEAAADVEARRQSSFVDNFIENDFATDRIDDHIFSQSDQTVESAVAESRPLFSAGNLPAEFVFGDIVGSYSRLDRAGCFGALLGMASRGEVVAGQATPFGAINCVAVC